MSTGPTLDGIPLIDSPYKYQPTRWVCVLFVALFALSSRTHLCNFTRANIAQDPTVIHIVQAVRYRLWWLLCTAVICGLAETLGWGARLSSNSNPFTLLPFLIQCVSRLDFLYRLLIKRHPDNAVESPPRCPVTVGSDVVPN